MAAKTKLLAKSRLCVAILNYDDVTLLATGITIANISGIETIIFTVVLDGSPVSRSIGIGQTSIITFATSRQATIGVSPFNGLPNFIVSGMDGYGIGSV